MNKALTEDAMKYLLPPYRCCGVSTRKYTNTGRSVSYICDVCAWSYRKDGTRKANNGRLTKHQIAEIDK